MIAKKLMLNFLFAKLRAKILSEILKHIRFKQSIPIKLFLVIFQIIADNFPLNSQMPQKKELTLIALESSLKHY